MVIGLSLRSGESKKFTNRSKTMYGMGDGSELLRIEPKFDGIEPDWDDLCAKFDKWVLEVPQLMWCELKLNQLEPGMVFTDEPWFEVEGAEGQYYWFYLGAQGS